jgi:putative redox protein
VSEAYRVAMRSVGAGPTALGSAGPFTLVADRPAQAGGGGLGFNGGQLLYLSIAACISNDLYREAQARGISLSEVSVSVDGDFPARGAPSTPIEVSVVVASPAPREDLEALVDEVDRIAEIPNSIRGTTPVTIVGRTLTGATGMEHAEASR